MMPDVVSQSEWLYSSLGGDPDLGELVELFVDEMPGKIATLMTQAGCGDLEQLARSVHQLKGSAGSYGFDQLTPCLQRLEHAIRNNGSAEQIAASLGELVELCGRARAGTPR